MRTVTSEKSGNISVVVNTPRGPVQISTGTKDPKEAQAVIKAANVESLEVLAKAGALSHAIIQRLVVGNTMTVPQAIEEWSQWFMDSAGSDRTAAVQISYAKAWANYTNARRLKLSEVSAKHISDYINAEDKCKLSTRRVRLASLRSLFRFAYIRQWISYDPSQEVRIKHKLLTHEQKETTKRPTFSQEEYQAVLDYLTKTIVKVSSQEVTSARDERSQRLQFWYCATIIGRYSGLRLGDIASLEWASIKPDRLIVWTDKRDARVEIPLTKELAHGIASIPKNNKVHCFPPQDAAGRHPTKRCKLSVEFKRILEGAGVENRSFHCLRSTLATELKIKGESLEEIAKALGHSNTRTTEGYIREKLG